jgi:hypothetical protein
VIILDINLPRLDQSFEKRAILGDRLGHC